MPDYDYSDVAEEQADDKQELLGRLAVNLDTVNTEVEQLEAQLKEAESRKRQLVETDIPELMLSMGVKLIETTNGLKVSLREEVRASLPKPGDPRRDQAFGWLDAHDHGGLVKNTLTVKLNKEQAELVDKLMDAIKAAEPTVFVEQKMDIHPQTLLAFLRERLKLGEEVPLPLFGAFVQKFAKVEKVK